jgi:hypothetical protein
MMLILAEWNFVQVEKGEVFGFRSAQPREEVFDVERTTSEVE